MVLIDSNKFRAVMYECMLSTGVEAEVANTVTESLIETSLKGVDSHGIHLFPHYYKELNLNRLNKNSNIEIKQKSPSVSILDAKNTFGHFAGKKAMLEAIQLAQHTGIGVVSVKNSTHFGAAWYFTDIAARYEMIGLALTNTEALVNAYGSKETFFGTNPIAFSAPMRDENPYCLDMATSTIPWNKVKNYKRQNKPLKLEWAYDNNGQPTIDPHQAVFGLGMFIEILCSGLTTGPMSKQIAPLYDLSITYDRNISHFFMALDISKFVSVDWFKGYLSDMATQIRNLPKVGTNDVMIAGDKEKMSYEHRKINGIPIEDSILLEFLLISNKFNHTIL
jgi:LDH2 family malate/lactate/ureidoglycolate dehydrogenase